MEGWLHHGTYHAALATSIERGRAAAADCLEGSAWFRKNCADALRPIPTIALTGAEIPHELEARWAECGVSVTALDDLSKLSRHVALHKVSAAYTAQDLAISVSSLRRRLENLLRKRVVRLRLEHHIRRLSARSYALHDAATDEKTVLRPAVTVVATGARSSESLKQLDIRHSLEFRLWRSHLLTAPRLPMPPIFFVDYDRPSVFPQDKQSLMGLNSDNQLITSRDDAPMEGLLERFQASFREHFSLQVDPAALTLQACYKIDVGETSAPRTVGTFVRRLEDDIWLLLPGKLTTAPVAADRLVDAIRDDTHTQGRPS
jgi:glycine/D-amino acid oxidase-like deaminating enzyme